MPFFNFTIDSFGITQTRSKHQDTDFVGFTLKLGTMDPTFLFAPIGNVNNGTHQVQLSFTGIELSQDDTFLFNYLIVNAGSAASGAISTALQNAGMNWANGDGPVPPPLTTANGTDNAWFAAQLGGIFHSTCDGVVASEQNQFPYGDLTARLSNGKFSHQTPQPGTHSPSGCGNNSQYTVNWHISEALLMPNVVGQPSDTPTHPPAKTVVQILNADGFRTVTWEQGTKGPLVSQQKPLAGYVDVGTPVTLWRGTKVP